MSESLLHARWQWIVGLALAAAPTVAGAAIVNFNSATDLNNFVERGGAAPSVYTWTNTTGIGTPVGSVTSTNAGSTANQNLYYNAATFSPASGPLQVSVFVKAGTATGTDYSRNFVGFATNTNVNLATDAGKIGVRLFHSNVAGSWSFQTQSGTSQDNIGSTFALTSGDWYKVTTTITRTAANTYTVAGELLDYGTDGNTLNLSFSRSGSKSYTNATMGADSTWNAGLLNQVNSFGGVTNFDNLSMSVVPEPGTLAGLVMAGALLVRRRRRGISV